MSRERISWLALGVFLMLPLISEDLTGLVYQDQSFTLILLDHIVAVSTFICCKALYGVHKRLYSDRLVLESQGLNE